MRQIKPATHTFSVYQQTHKTDNLKEIKISIVRAAYLVGGT